MTGRTRKKSVRYFAVCCANFFSRYGALSATTYRALRISCISSADGNRCESFSVVMQAVVHSNRAPCHHSNQQNPASEGGNMNTCAQKIFLVMVTALTTLLAARGGGGGYGGNSGSGGMSYPGTLGVSMTDAPACGFDALNVTVKQGRVHQNSTANDTDGGWGDIPPSP